jgi:hypothetical protein
MKQSKRRSPEELQDQRRSQFVDDIAKIRVQWNALKELLPTIVVKEIKIINDSDETFDFEIYLQPNQKDRLKKLWELACMEIPTCSAEGDGYCRWGASMVSFGSEWILLGLPHGIPEEVFQKYSSRRHSYSHSEDVAKFRRAAHAIDPRKAFFLMCLTSILEPSLPGL